MPRRIIIAYWLIVFGAISIAKLIVLLAMLARDGNQLFAEHSGQIVFGALYTIALGVAYIIAGKWIKAADARGHYLAAGAVGLALLLSLARPDAGSAVSAVFLYLLLSDLKNVRSTPDFSLRVHHYHLDEFWPLPWLISATTAAILGHGQGAIPAVVIHLISPFILLYLHNQLRKSATVNRDQTTGKYRLSVILWLLFYLASLAIGAVVLRGLAGLAMQGAGK